MHVLISIQQRVPQWQIPEAAARSLIARFPDVRFTYATTEDERARGLADRRCGLHLDPERGGTGAGAEAAVGAQLRGGGRDASACPRCSRAASASATPAACRPCRLPSTCWPCCSPSPSRFRSRSTISGRRAGRSTTTSAPACRGCCAGRTLGLIGVGTIGARAGLARLGAGHAGGGPATAGGRRRRARRRRASTRATNCRRCWRSATRWRLPRR